MRVHISLNVTSLEVSLRFYQGLFGQPPSKIRDDYANFRLDRPPIHLALQQGSPTGACGVSHVGIELPDADSLAAWRTRLESDGVKFIVEDKARCCYATADKLWLTDPDGYRWEIWVRNGDMESRGETRVDLATRKAACCAA